MEGAATALSITSAMPQAVSHDRHPQNAVFINYIPHMPVSIDSSIYLIPLVPCIKFTWGCGTLHYK